MQVQNINNYNLSYNINPAFTAGRGKPLDLVYILNKHKGLLPYRVQTEAQKAVRTNRSNLPTLRKLHEQTYAELKDCKTLEDVKVLFPEFAGVKDALNSFEHVRGNIKTLKEQGKLNEKLSLKILKNLWADLKNQEEIAKELGLTNRSALTYILEKLHIPTFSTNYRTLMLSSEPETHAIIAGKTTAWNAAHPDLMRAHNKMAAQGNKAQWRREASSLRMKEYDLMHPERLEKITEYRKEVWARVPQVRKKLKQCMSEQSAVMRKVIAKDINGEPLNMTEERMKAILYKKFWEKHPECLEQYRQACKEVSAARKK